MKERGLICKDDEVSAILDGRKTVFRRPVTSIGRFGRIVGEGSRGYSIACLERLHAITEDDAVREGMCRKGVSATGRVRASFRAAFENMWGRHYNKSHAWSENPFVWRVEFRRRP